MCINKGFPFAGIIGFGISSVYSLNLVPLPPANISTDLKVVMILILGCVFNNMIIYYDKNNIKKTIRITKNGLINLINIPRKDEELKTLMERQND